MMYDQRLALLNRIRAIEFMLVELNLYLNSHPHDRRAIMEYNRYVQQFMHLKMQYSASYGPISQFEYSQYPWKWINDPWPWEQDLAREDEMNVAL